MSSITIYLTNSSGVPLSGQTVKLRRAGLDNFGTDYLTMSDVSGKPGKYETTDDYVTDRYKVWVNGSEDRSFGGPDGIEITKKDDILLKSGGTMSGAINMGGNKITDLGTAVDGGDALSLGQATQDFLAKSGGTMSGAIDMDGNPLSGVPDPIEDDDGANKQWVEQTLVDEDYAKRQENNTFTGTSNIFNNGVTFTGQASFPNNPPITDENPTSDNHLTRRAWVLEQLAGIIVTPFQESKNVIRIQPGQIQQTGKCYPTYAGGLAFAQGYADANWRFILKIEGGGESSTSVDVPEFSSYCSIQGGNHLVRLNIDDAAYAVSDGTMIVEGVTLTRDDDGNGDPSFTNVIFVNCYFDFDTNSLNFINCQFRSECIVKNTGTVTFDGDTRGNVRTTGASLGTKMTGHAGLNSDQL